MIYSLIKKIFLLLLVFCFFPDSFAQDYNRIISLSPNITEILYAVGVEGKIVGITDFCRVHKEEKERVGGVLNPNIEKIISLNPDLIISMQSVVLLKKLKRLDVELLTVKNETLSDLYDSLDILGDKLKIESKTDSLVQYIRKCIDFYRTKTEGRNKPKVLFVVSKDITSLKNIYAAGESTFLNEIINICGGKNIINERDVRYPKIGKEEIIKKNPDIIFDTSLGGEVTEEKIKTNIKEWEKLKTVSAVKKKNVVYLNDPTITILGPNIIETVKKLGKYINPEVFNE